MSDATTAGLDIPSTHRPTGKVAASGRALGKTAERVQRELGLSDSALGDLLGVSEKTLKRRKTDGSFDRGEAFQLEVLERILEVAFETFKDPEDARAWLRSPVLSLDKQVPLSLVTTLAGYERVTDVLYRQADGMF
ncbi:hypothetical protein BH24DEI2_BH24DEI2_23900 [soil metagenome]